MAHREYIFIQSDAAQFESLWTALIAELNTLVEGSSKGFLMSKPAAAYWILVDITDSYPIEALVEKLGMHITGHVYGFAYHTVVDGFAYWHYADHQLSRHFDYGLFGEGERTWNTAIGRAEAWEESVFFTAEDLQDELENFEADEDEDEDEDAALRQEILDIYTEKRIRIGSMYPFLGDAAVMRIPDAAGFPGGFEGFVAERSFIVQRPPKRGFFSRLFGG